MQQKQKHIRLGRYTAAILVLVAIAAAVLVLEHSRTDAASAAKPPIGAAVPSQFKFTGATGWWQGATNKTSMALFPKAQDCFVSVEHSKGTIAAAKDTFLKTEASLTSQGYTITHEATLPVALQTNMGKQTYQLQQSAVTTPAGATKIEGGQEFGYVQLSSGYLNIQGYCNTTDELTATIPALQSVKFNEVD